MIIESSPDQDVTVYGNAVVLSGASMVFSQDFQRAFSPWAFNPATELCDEERGGTLIRSMVDGRAEFAFKDQPEVVAFARRKVIPFNMLHFYNYFHFLIEWMPSLLWLMRNADVRKDMMIATGGLHPNMWEALHLLIRNVKMPVAQLMFMQGIACEHVVQLRPSWRGTELMSGGVSEATFNRSNLVGLRKRFEEHWADAPRDRKIFIRRASRMRHMLNVEQVEAAARAAGFEIVDPGTLSFLQQVSLFSTASHIVGPTGAWIANLAFAPDGARVGVIYPETVRTKRPFWAELGDIFGLQMDTLYCPVPQLWDEHPIHSDFRVAIPELRALLHG